MAKAKTIELGIKFDSNGKEILGKLAIDSEQLAATIASVNKQAKDFQQNMSNWGFFAEGVNQAVSAVNQLGSAVDDASAMYESFDKSMRAANTMAEKSGKEFDSLKESVNALGKEVPVARDALANGLYEVISNGVPEDNWLKFLETSARSSVGGMADLGQTVTVTSTILKNYALDWEKAGEVQDKIQLAAKNGKTSFEQMAASLPRVAGNASALGVSINELLASFATLTGVSGNTAESSTQLAAVFTALLKPSSEATELAQKMGIQFDAAAIQAAGGFKNFLANLKESVSAYSAASGELEQSVMAKLFGSAESLRALGPLMGNLSDKFSENVDAMVKSAGTMDAAYAKMSGSAEAKRQIWENMYASIMDNVGAMARYGQSMIFWTGKVSDAVIGGYKLYQLKKSLNMAATVGAAKTRILAFGLKTYGIMLGRTAVTQKLLNSAMAQGAIKGTALSVAIRGIMMATGVGAALMTLVFLYNKLSASADEATESTNSLASAQEEFKRKSAEVKAEMMQEASELKKLMDSHRDTRIEVEKLESKYGDIFGKHKTAAEWYDVLTTKSTKYAQALGYLAQMEQLRTEMAAATIEKEQNDNRIKEIKDTEGERTYHAPETVLTSTGMPMYRPGFTSKNPKLVPLEKAAKNTQKRIDDIQEKIDIATKKAEALMKEAGVNPVKEVPEVTESGKDKGDKKETNLYKGNKYTNPAELKTVEDFENRIAYLENERKTATRERAKLLQNEIDFTRQLMAEWEGTGEAIDKTANVQRKYGDELRKAVSIGDTLEKLAEADRKLAEQQEKSSGEEYVNIQRNRDALEKKRQQLEAMGKIPALELEMPSIEKELDELRMLDGKELRIKLQAIGADKLQAQMSTIGDMIDALSSQMSLAGMDSEQYTVLREQRERLRGLREEMKGLEKSAEKSGESVTEAIGSMGSSLAGLGNAIELPELNVAGTMAQAIATLVAGFSKASEQSSLFGPFGWLAFTATGLAQLTAVVSSVKQLPQFAEGGIAYGPTLGLFGEYAGASNNPEVVAPLDRLRTLIRPADGSLNGKVEFEISGRNLRGVLARVDRVSSRS